PPALRHRGGGHGRRHRDHRRDGAALHNTAVVEAGLARYAVRCDRPTSIGARAEACQWKGSGFMVRAGVIGCGDVARRAYIPGVQELGDRITVVAAFDTIAERAQDIAGMFPDASAYTSLDEFLAHEGGMDLVFNLTP